MDTKDKQNIQDFWVIGVNYKKTDASIRGLFAINTDQYDHLLLIAPQYNLKEFFILSTCNRTEVYGFAESPSQLADLLCSECAGSADTFSELAYTKNRNEAIEHLFHVAAGLDSQILGDYEILGQIKKSVKQAKAQGFIGAFMERLINSVLQASKAIKTNTGLSGGTVSVSFAAVHYIKEFFGNIKDRKIILLGTGKIGRSTCRNLVDYLNTNNITLINRTEETAVDLATELSLHSAPIEALESELQSADIIIVSTGAADPVILKKHLEGYGDKLIVDLSVPSNVEVEAKQLPGITFVDVDMLSKIKDETLQQRKAEVPKAVAIINEHVADFKEWYDMRRNVPVLKEVKNKLKEIHIDPALLNNNHSCKEQLATYDERIQKVINTLATKMRRDYTPGCHYIQAINEFIA
ncbi:MAG: glutamyl-tRNA reductase [Chitinophagales bacterium]